MNTISRNKIDTRYGGKVPVSNCINLLTYIWPISIREDDIVFKWTSFKTVAYIGKG